MYRNSNGYRLCSTVGQRFLEYAFMKGLMKNDFRLAKRFNNTVRYSDDLLALNNMYFAEEIPNIYLAGLVLKKTTESLAVVSYLALPSVITSSGLRSLIREIVHIVNFPFLNI